MEIGEHIEHLAAQGELLAQAAKRAPPDAPVPSCPGWQLRDLLASIHRADAQLAAAPGQPPAAHPAGLAADGIDELVTGFGGRKPGKLADSPATLVIRAGDGPGAPAWTVVMGQPDARVSHGASPAAPGERYCEVSGPAPDPYLTLWNRRPADGLDVRGDSGVLASWLDRLHVRWA